MFDWSSAVPLSIQLTMSADQRIYFVSDLHLGDGTRSDTFMGKETEFLAFLEKVRSEGAHLVIVGDFIDFSQAWAMSRVLRAHGKILGALSDMASTTGVTYIWGNHDYDIALFKDVLRFTVCSTLTIGDGVLVEHGYQHDPFIGPDLDQGHLVTVAHHMVERLFRTWIRIPLEHHYVMGSRFSFWLGHKVALLARAKGRVMEALGFKGSLDKVVAFEKYWIHGQMGDSQGIFEGVREVVENGPFHTVITGHSHVPGLVELKPGRYFANTGSWTFSSAQYAVWDGQRVSVHDWIQERTYGDENYRQLVDRTFEHKDFMHWWRENYMGWMRFRCGEERGLQPLKLVTAARPEHGRQTG